MNLTTIRDQLFRDDQTGGKAACFVIRAACLARQPGKCAMAVCPKFVKSEGGPAVAACVGRDRVEFLSEVLKRLDWHCPLGRF